MNTVSGEEKEEKRKGREERGKRGEKKRGEKKRGKIVKTLERVNSCTVYTLGLRH